MSWIVICIFLAISAVHFYWALGGRWAGDRVFPELDRKPTLKPGPLPTVLVALIFIGFAWLIFEKSRTPGHLPVFLEKYGLPILALIFLIRAIGDFRHAGFFKKKKGGLFAQYDTRFYSPLCLLVAILLFLIQLEG